MRTSDWSRSAMDDRVPTANNDYWLSEVRSHSAADSWVDVPLEDFDFEASNQLWEAVIRGCRNEDSYNRLSNGSSGNQETAAFAFGSSDSSKHSSDNNAPFAPGTANTINYFTSSISSRGSGSRTSPDSGSSAIQDPLGRGNGVDPLVTAESYEQRSIFDTRVRSDVVTSAPDERPYYDPSRSFFDNISCRGSVGLVGHIGNGSWIQNGGTGWARHRARNAETFGMDAVARQLRREAGVC
jgi:hypothetical protein